MLQLFSPSAGSVNPVDLRSLRSIRPYLRRDCTPPPLTASESSSSSPGSRILLWIQLIECFLRLTPLPLVKSESISHGPDGRRAHIRTRSSCCCCWTQTVKSGFEFQHTPLHPICCSCTNNSMKTWSLTPTADPWRFESHRCARVVSQRPRPEMRMRQQQ